MTIVFANPFAMLHATLDASPNLQKLFASKLLDHPSSPESAWGLILHSDEVTPGNVLQTIEGNCSAPSSALQSLGQLP